MLIVLPRKKSTGEIGDLGGAAWKTISMYMPLSSILSTKQSQADILNKLQSIHSILRFTW